jgi:transposase
MWCELPGLVPLEESSENRRRLGHVTKQGSSMLRFLLVEAAQVTVRACGRRKQSIYVRVAFNNTNVMIGEFKMHARHFVLWHMARNTIIHADWAG